MTELAKLSKELGLEEIIQISDNEITVLDYELGLKHVISKR